MLRLHLIRVSEREHRILPDAFEARHVHNGLADHLEAQVHLLGGSAGFAVEL